MPLNESEKTLLDQEESRITQSMSNLTPAKIGMSSLLKQRYLNADRQVYHSLEFASASSEESIEEYPYSNNSFSKSLESQSKSQNKNFKSPIRTLSKAQSELDILKVNRVKESSLMKSKAYHKVYIEKLNKKYLKSQ